LLGVEKYDEVANNFVQIVAACERYYCWYPGKPRYPESVEPIRRPYLVLNTLWLELGEISLFVLKS